MQQDHYLVLDKQGIFEPDLHCPVPVPVPFVVVSPSTFVAAAGPSVEHHQCLSQSQTGRDWSLDMTYLVTRPSARPLTAQTPLATKFAADPWSHLQVAGLIAVAELLCTDFHKPSSCPLDLVSACITGIAEYTNLIGHSNSAFASGIPEIQGIS